MNNNILIYEPFVSGHHKEYILHLLNFLQEGKRSKYDNIHFYLHPDLENELIQKYKSPSIHFLWKRKEDSFNDVFNYIQENEINHFFFMYLDSELIHPRHLDLLHKNKIQTQGIYFRPYNRISDSEGSIFRKLNFHRIRLLQKHHLSKNATKINRILVLNDLDAVKDISREMPQGNFSFLCDPMDDYNIGDGEQMRKKLGIGNDTAIILSFGSQDERKNTLSLVKAMDKVAMSYTNDLVLCVVGVIHQVEYANKITDEAQRLNEKHKNLKVLIFNEYADKDDFFNIANIVAVPYINFFFSSGIFISAAHYRKSILASNIGLMKSLIDKYLIGKTVNPYSEKSIAEGLLHLIENKIPQENFNKYLKDNVHSRDEFANTILN